MKIKCRGLKTATNVYILKKAYELYCLYSLFKISVLQIFMHKYGDNNKIF